MNKYRLSWEQIIVSLLIGIGIGYIISEILSKNCTFFIITLDNIINYAITIFIGYGIYRFSKKDGKEEKRNNKMEDRLNQIIDVCENDFDMIGDGIGKDEVRICLRRVSNALSDLKKLSSSTKYSEDIEHIDKNFVEFEKYMSEHSEMSLEELMKNTDRKNRIKDYISKIKDKCNEILCDFLN